MAPVCLQTELQCTTCAKRIHKLIKNMLGVKEVRVSMERGLVVVVGNADAEMLRWRIEQLLKRPVVILSDGREAYRYLYPASRPHHRHPALLPGGYPAWRPNGYPYPPPPPMLPPAEDYPYPYGGAGYPAAWSCAADDYF